MNITRAISAFFLIITFVNAKAQLTQTSRYEKDKNFMEDNFIVISAKEKGILLLRESDEKVENERGNIWQVISLDSELNEVWDNKIVVEYKYLILGYDYFDGNLYLLFGEEFGSKKNVFKIIKIAKKEGTYEQFEISTELYLQPTHLLINDDQLVLGGEINSRLTFVLFKYKEDKVTVVPGFFNKKSIILDANYNKKHQAYNLLLAEKNAANRNELTIKSFNKEGKVFIDERIEFEEEIRAINGKVHISDNMRVYFSGSFGGYKSYYSQGIYFGYLEGGKEPNLQFHNLTEFDHIFDYLPEKRAKKIRTKIDKGIAKGKPYEYKTQLWVQDFYDQEDNFVLLSDIYRPEYDKTLDASYPGVTIYDSKNETNQKYSQYTSGITNVQDSEKIKYLEAVLMLFDHNGKLIADMSLPTPNAEMLELDEFSSSYVSSTNSSLIYKDENEIRYTLYDADFSVTYDSLQNINVFVEGDSPTRVTDNEGRVEKWYENHFFVWGYHRVSSKNDKNRNVFYINKITIEQ
ncbi:MAG: hypothetical protein OEX22_06710 [Cyclobacteriaceae bacterium]|nr:hypothetical protein [Cyclobacteriaceae bacterium]